MKKCYLESRGRWISYLDWSYSALKLPSTTDYNLSIIIEGKIKGGYEWQKDEEEDVGSYWMTLRKGGNTHIRMRKIQIALCGELALEEALDLSWDRLLNECIIFVIKLFAFYCIARLFYWLNETKRQVFHPCSRTCIYVRQVPYLNFPLKILIQRLSALWRACRTTVRIQNGHLPSARGGVIRTFWDTAPRHWLIGVWHFEAAQRSVSRGHKSSTAHPTLEVGIETS
jgi:hypothetical protein